MDLDEEAPIEHDGRATCGRRLESYASPSRLRRTEGQRFVMRSLGAEQRPVDGAPAVIGDEPWRIERSGMCRANS